MAFRLTGKPSSSGEVSWSRPFWLSPKPTPGAVCLWWKHSLTRRLEHAALRCAAWQLLPGKFDSQTWSFRRTAQLIFFVVCLFHFLWLTRQYYMNKNKSDKNHNRFNHFAEPRRGPDTFRKQRFTGGELQAKLTHNLWLSSCRHNTVSQCKVQPTHSGWWRKRHHKQNQTERLVWFWPAVQ